MPKPGLIVLFLMLVMVNFSFSQKTKKHYLFYAGMGLQYGATPDFTDYLRNEIPYTNSDSISTFNTGIEFVGGFEYEFSKDFSVKLDYSYFLRSLRYEYYYNVFDYTITNHQPYIFLNYAMFQHPSYKIKLGLGAGYHFQQLDNNVNTTQTLSYSSSGPSIRLEAAFTPKFSKTFYGYLSGFGFLNFYGKIKDENGVILKPNNSDAEASLNGHGIGVRLGFLFYLN